MFSIERVKELLNDPKLSDKEIEGIRDGCIHWSRLYLNSGKQKGYKLRPNKKMVRVKVK